MVIKNKNGSIKDRMPVCMVYLEFYVEKNTTARFFTKHIICIFIDPFKRAIFYKNKRKSYYFIMSNIINPFLKKKKPSMSDLFLMSII